MSEKYKNIPINDDCDCTGRKKGCEHCPVACEMCDSNCTVGKRYRKELYAEMKLECMADEILENEEVKD